VIVNCFKSVIIKDDVKNVQNVEDVEDVQDVMKDKKLNFYNLRVWRLAMELVHFIYQLCKKFPKEEMFSLTSQMKRAVISVPLNIAEGTGRRT